MRDRAYIVGFLAGAGLLFYFGRDLLQRSELVTLGLTFAGTTATGVLGLALYRVQLELRASRHELARREAELSFAREVQAALFPRQFPRDSGLEFAGACIPARGISGDYYDVLQASDGRLIFTIADISGKGISAAMLMSNLHAASRALVGAGATSDEIACQLNRHLYEVTSGERFATFFYAQWRREARSLGWVNAGHNAPILLTSSGARRLRASGPPLGLFAEPKYSPEEIRLERGDVLILFSDGVTEANNARGDEFGEARLENAVTASRGKPLEEILRHVQEMLRHWAGEELEDDMTLLLVRVAAGGEEAT